MSAEDAEAAKLMAEWEANNPDDGKMDEDDDDDDDEPKSYDDMLEQFRREVYPGDNELDHIVLACSDLDQGIEDFEKLTGVKPVFVVSLNGMGTKSARVTFQEPIFLELIAPDPKQATQHMGSKLAGIPPGKFVPLHYAVRSTGLEERKKAWKEIGLGCDMVTMVAKDRGMPWNWDMWIIQEHTEGGLIPYFCDWKGGTHASGRLPILGNFGKVTVTAPSSSPIHKLLDGFGNINVETGPEKFEFEFTSPTGSHSFSADSMIGITFPEYVPE